MNIDIITTLLPSRNVRHVTVVARVEGCHHESMADAIGPTWLPCDPGLDGDVALAKAANELAASFAMIGNRGEQP